MASLMKGFIRLSLARLSGRCCMSSASQIMSKRLRRENAVARLRGCSATWMPLPVGRGVDAVRRDGEPFLEEPRGRGPSGLRAAPGGAGRQRTRTSARWLRTGRACLLPCGPRRSLSSRGPMAANGALHVAGAWKPSTRGRSLGRREATIFASCSRLRVVGSGSGRSMDLSAAACRFCTVVGLMPQRRARARRSLHSAGALDGLPWSWWRCRESDRPITRPSKRRRA